MSIKIIDDTKLSSIGDAIRAKAGTSELITLDKMPQAINAIPIPVDRLGARANSSCAGDLVIPANIKSVNGNAYYGCGYLTSVKGEGITAVQQNGFMLCGGITKFDFGKSTYSTFNVNGSGIGSNWYSGCWACTAFIIRYMSVASLAVSPTSNNGALPPTITNGGTGYVYVPRSLVDSYKSATNWSVVADQIRAIEDYPDICG
jgi:hypothetical protein